MQAAVYPVGASINALRIVYELIAVGPLTGMAVAYALPSNLAWGGIDISFRKYIGKLGGLRFLEH